MIKTRRIWPNVAILPLVLLLSGWDIAKSSLDLGQAASKLEERLPLSGQQNPVHKVFVNDLVSGSMIDPFADFLYRRILFNEKKLNRLVKRSDPRYQVVEEVFKDIKRSAINSRFGNIARTFDWKISLIEDDRKNNAFAWPGGKVVVYTGVWPFAKNKAGLAAVLGHEVVHALARHAAQRINKNVLAGVSITQLAKSSVSDPDTLKPEIAAPILDALMLKATTEYSALSRSQEREADIYGLFLAALAGYDPEEALLYWSRQLPHNDIARSSSPSSHPGTSERFKELNSRMAEPLIAYRKQKDKHKPETSMELLPLKRVNG